MRSSDKLIQTSAGCRMHLVPNTKFVGTDKGYYIYIMLNKILHKHNQIQFDNRKKHDKRFFFKASKNHLRC
jgi:hypothetical protein